MTWWTDATWLQCCYIINTSWMVIRSASCVVRGARGKGDPRSEMLRGIKLELSETTNPPGPNGYFIRKRTRGEPALCNVPELTVLKRDLGQIVDPKGKRD
jgi:hypothetical protein